MFGMTPFYKRSSSLQQVIDHFFKDDFFSHFSLSKSFQVDVKQEQDAYVVEAELPGYKKEDIELTYENQTLTIKATRNAETKLEKDQKVLHQERYYGEVTRQFYLPNVKEDEIKAKFENGILTITLPFDGKKNNQIVIE